MSCVVQGKGMESRNLLNSLPSCLVRCIVSDWMNIISLIRLDFASSVSKNFQALLLEFFRSDQFCLKEVKRTINSGIYCHSLRRNHPFSRMINWLTVRQIKVAGLELHPNCCNIELKNYLQLLGAHVRHVCPHEDYNILLGNRIFATQSSLIAEHCHNLTSASLCTYKAYPGSILAILKNNDCLEKLDFNGGLYGEDSLSRYPTLTLPHLKQLKWYMKYGFDESLVTLIRAAPNLQQLSLSCNSSKCTDIGDALIISVARACPHLRTLSCKELHLEPNDRSLMQFLSLCTQVVNLDLSMHCELTDGCLIAALQHLPNLHCLDLRGCCRLTDTTLHFLAQRFASTLQVLYLDHSTHFDYDHGHVNVLGQLIMRPELKGGYTAEAIANLRAQCTRLHTYHYVLRIDEDLPRLVQVYVGYEALLPMILEHCQKLQIIAMLVDEYSGEQVMLSVDELVSVAARCPLLHTVIIENNNKDAPQVDYSELKTRFPKLVFTESLNARSTHLRVLLNLI